MGHPVVELMKSNSSTVEKLSYLQKTSWSAENGLNGWKVDSREHNFKILPLPQSETELTFEGHCERDKDS